MIVFEGLSVKLYSAVVSFAFDGGNGEKICGLRLNGEQGFDYVRSPRVGETLTGTGRITEVYERDSGAAVMEFYVRETEWRDADGAPVVTERFTLIVRRRKDEG